jgi:hypothetical protein
MSNAMIIPEQEALSTPDAHAAQQEPSSEFVDLDAGDSLLEQKPDDGQDVSGVPAEKDAKATDETPDEADEAGADEDDDADIAALTAQPEKAPRLSGSARLKAKLAEANAEIERLRQAVPKVDDATALASAVEREIGPPPKEADFDDYLAYQEAKTAYKTAEMLVSRELRKNAEAAQQAHQAQSNEIVAAFRERADDLRKLVKDFDEALAAAPAAPTHQDVAMAILESEKGPHIAYYLSKHPEKVNEINGMPLRRALAEIGKLEARLTPTPRKETKAPAPVAPVKGGGKTEQTDPEKLSMNDFAKWYDARKNSRA